MPDNYRYSVIIARYHWVRSKNMSKFCFPEDLSSYISKTVRLLRDKGFENAANTFEKINNSVFTSGSERLCEIGHAINSIQEAYSIPENMKEILEIIMYNVNDVWP